MINNKISVLVPIILNRYFRDWLYYITNIIKYLHLFKK